MNNIIIQPKYRIAKLLRQRFGELAFKRSVEELSKFCQLKSKRTVSEWLKIEAGSTTEIDHLIIPKLLIFFNLKHPNQLLSKEHKQIIKIQK